MSDHRRCASEGPTRIRPLFRFSSLLFLLIFAGCGGGTQTPKSAGEVVERAEGFSERPPWADPNNPFSRKDNTVRVLGYVGIDETQRLEAGFRAADSYARSELVRFLSTRVAAVLQDDLSSQEGEAISEAITESSHLLIDDISITSHYWEKVREKGGAKVHLYSRIDVDQEIVVRLLSRVWEAHGDLRTPLADVQKTVKDQWDALGNVANVHSSTDLLPGGIYTPGWAASGDEEDEQEFRFVCHGLAPEDQTAQSLAGRMCTEKLCRLFGVQIKSTTRVRENLEGLQVESEVVEGCLDVHIEGRKTEFSGGECGPRGCVQWILQSYPKSSYQAEKKRLENPTIVERQIVVQEGGLKYKDPAACEAELRSYGSVQGRKLPNIEQRIAILKRALGACQGIDARDSGLFARLWHLIEKPLPSFVNASSEYDRRFEDDFLYGSSAWFEELSTARFIDERLRQVIAILEDALLPVRAYDVLEREPESLKAIQKVMRPLYAYPFGSMKAFRTHARNMHEVHPYRKKGQTDPEFFRFLVTQADARGYPCHWVSPLNGGTLINHLAANAPNSEEFWQSGIKVLMKAESDSSSCATKLLEAQPSAKLRMKRTDEIVSLLKSERLKFEHSLSRNKYQSGVDALGTLIGNGVFTPEESMTLFLRWEPQMKGSEKERAELMKRLLSRFEPKSSERDAKSCDHYLDQVEIFQAERSYYGFEMADEDLLCDCLEGDRGVIGQRRQQLVLEMSQKARRLCNWVSDDEWPGGVGEEVKRPPPPLKIHSPPGRIRDAPIVPGQPANPWDVASELQKTMEICFRDTEVETPYNGVLSTWTEISGIASSSGLNDVKARVQATTKFRSLERRDSKGWPSRDAVRRTEAKAEACLLKVAKEMRPTPGTQLDASSPSRVWLLFSSDDIVDAYQVKN
jgi:hypothetical protein